jgi:hypothetical protein
MEKYPKHATPKESDQWVILGVMHPHCTPNKAPTFIRRCFF